MVDLSTKKEHSVSFAVISTSFLNFLKLNPKEEKKFCIHTMKITAILVSIHARTLYHFSNSYQLQYKLFSCRLIPIRSISAQI